MEMTFEDRIYVLEHRTDGWYWQNRYTAAYSFGVFDSAVIAIAWARNEGFPIR